MAKPAKAASSKNLPDDIEEVSLAFTQAMPDLIGLAGSDRKAVDAILAQHNAFDRLLWEARAASLDKAASGFKAIAAEADKAKAAAKKELKSLQKLKQTLDAVSTFLNIASRLITEFRV